MKEEDRDPGHFYIFAKAGFKVEINLLDGKTAWILYRYQDKISEDTIQTLLENNAEGSVWNKVESKKPNPVMREVDYQRSDRLADAKYQEVGSYYGLIIISKAWRRAHFPESGL